MVRRMISTEVTDTDKFLELPASTQNLYYYMICHADDDGFLGNPKTIVRSIGAKIDDLNNLIEQDYLINFEDGVVVIKDWLRHNKIRKDRYQPTVYQDDFKKIELNEIQSYQLVTSFNSKKENGLQETNLKNKDGLQEQGSKNESSVTQVKLSKVKLSKDNNILSDSKSNADHPQKNKSKNQEIEKEFETLWKHYPKKAGKPQALSHYKAWRKKSTKNTYDVMRDKLKNYLEYLKIKNISPEYTLNGSTWFNGRFDDELDMTKPVSKRSYNQKTVRSSNVDWDKKQEAAAKATTPVMSDEEMNAIFQGSGGGQ